MSLIRDTDETNSHNQRFCSKSMSVLSILLPIIKCPLERMRQYVLLSWLRLFATNKPTVNLIGFKESQHQFFNLAVLNCKWNLAFTPVSTNFLLSRINYSLLLPSFSMEYIFIPY